MSLEAGSISVVVAAHNEREHLARTVRALRRTLPGGAEIVVVDDGSTDGSVDALLRAEHDVVAVRHRRRTGVSASRNHGAEIATGEVIVFADGHVDPREGWIDALCHALAQPGVGVAGPAILALGDARLRGYGFTWSDPTLSVEWLDRQAPDPYPVPFLGGGLLAVRSEVFRSLGGFDRGMRGWGSEDAELTLRAWLMGLDSVVVPAAEVAHVFREDFPYRIGWPAVVHNRMRLAELHLTGERHARVFAALADMPGSARALELLDRTHVGAERRALAARRRRGDDAFFDRFGLDWWRLDTRGEQPVGCAHGRSSQAAAHPDAQASEAASGQADTRTGPGADAATLDGGPGPAEHRLSSRGRPG